MNQRRFSKRAAAAALAAVIALAPMSMPIAADEIVVAGEEISVTLSFAGDCTLGTDLKYGKDNSFMQMYENKQPNADAYFLENVKSIFENDDLTIVNLEGPLTNAKNPASKQFAFRGLPEYTGILTEGSVEVVNLANNHSKDYGTTGYNDTLANLSAAGIDSYGYDRKCITQVKGINVGFLGYTAWNADNSAKNQITKDIESLKEQGAHLVITTFHGGVEGAHYPNSQQKTLAKHAIDNGADLVIQHHPHVIQGIEIYNGKYIAYSLGNFCFGGNRNPTDKDTYIFQQTFDFDKDTLEKLDSKAQIYPCSVSSVKSRNDFRPTPLTGDDIQRFMTRIQSYSYDLNGKTDVVSALLADANAAPTVEYILADTTGIYYQDAPLSFDLPLFFYEGEFFVPLRQFFESLQAEVRWNAESGKIEVSAKANADDLFTRTTAFKIGSNQYEALLFLRDVGDTEPISPEPLTMAYPIHTYQGNAYISLQTAAAVLGYTAAWDSVSDVITIQ